MTRIKYQLLVGLRKAYSKDTGANLINLPICSGAGRGAVERGCSNVHLSAPVRFSRNSISERRFRENDFGNRFWESAVQEPRAGMNDASDPTGPSFSRKAAASQDVGQRDGSSVSRPVYHPNPGRYEGRLEDVRNRTLSAIVSIGSDSGNTADFS